MPYNQSSPFQITMQVRDYELDQFGVVNNAIYFHYLEHARHQFLLNRGIDAAQYAAQGQALTVAEISCRYLQPLRSGENFQVSVEIAAITGARVNITQKIMRDETTPIQLIAQAKVVAVFLDARNRPQRVNAAIRAQLGEEVGSKSPLA